MRNIESPRLMSSSCARLHNYLSLFARYLCIVTFIIMASAGSRAEAPWMDSAWSQRAPFTVTNAGPMIANYQVSITLDTGSFNFADAKPDGSDIRVTASDGVTKLPYWIELWDATKGTAKVWVKIPALATAQRLALYVYYGNASASGESDGASTFAFYDGFEKPFSGSPLENAPQPTTTVVSARGGGTTDQIVHPGIVQFATPWHGWEYWMVVTPYPNGNDYYENPSLLVSHDGQTWQEPAGITNPISLPDQSYLADADLFYNADTDELWIYYPHQVVDGSTIYMIRRTSKDGINWGPQLEDRDTQALFTAPDFNVLSPAVLKVNGTYWMWSVNTGPSGCGSTDNVLEYRNSMDGVNWSAPMATNFPPSEYQYTPWHPDVIYVPSKGEFWAVVSSYPHDGCGDTVLVFITSKDGVNWTTYKNVALPKGSSWDSGQIYRSTLLYDEATDTIRVWYSANNGSAWHLGYAERNFTEFMSLLSADSSADWTVDGGGSGSWSRSSEQTMRGSYSAKLVQNAGGNMVVHKTQPTPTNFYQEWDLYDDLDQTAFKQVRVRSNDQRVGIGVWTGCSPVLYCYHNTTYEYTPTNVTRTLGWHKFGIRLSADGVVHYYIDGNDVGSAASQFTNANMADIEGYENSGATTTAFYVDDVRVRLYSSPEPTVAPGLPPANQSPVANNDNYTVQENQQLVVPANLGVLANDTDPDGDVLTAIVVANPTHGSLTLNAAGSLSYNPEAGYMGTDTFSYRAFDGQDYSSAAIVSITVTTALPPTAVNDSYSAYQDQTLTISASSGVLHNDFSSTGLALSAELVSGATHGRVTLNADGSFAYFSQLGFSGTDSFAYRAYDGVLYGAPATVMITVLPVQGASFNPLEWQYKRAVTVTNSGSALNDYQVQVALDAAFDFANANADGSDIVFTAADGVSVLPFWTEAWNPGSGAIFWIRMPAISAGSSTIYMYYGNAKARATSSAATTFNFYDGFETASEVAPLTNASSYVTLPTYDGSGQGISPSVMYFQNSWHGYKYWMVMTPLPNGNDVYRNPSILVSNDGASWALPAGLVNPVISGGQNTEPTLYYNEGTDELWIYFVNETGAHTVRRMTSVDGIHWSAPQTLYSVPLYQNLSSSVAKVGDTYFLWTVNAGSAGCSATSNAIQYRTSADGINWSQPSNISIFGASYFPFHVTVQQVPSKGEYWMLISAYGTGQNCANAVLQFAKSTDGINWTAYPNSALRNGSGWDNALIHTSSLVYDPASDQLNVWYGASSTTGAYRIGYTQNSYSSFLNALTAPGPWTRSTGTATFGQSSNQARRGTYSGQFIEANGDGTSSWIKAQSLPNSFFQEWDLYDDLSQGAFKMVRVLNDAGNRVGIGVYTGQSTANYAYHNTSYSYFTTSVPRSVGWHKFGIRLTSDSVATFFIDGNQVGSLSGAFNNATKVDLEGLDTPLATTYYIDDIRVRRYVVPEPATSIGDENPTDHSPLVTNPGDQTNREGEVASLQVQASDPDVGQTLTFSASGLPPGLEINPESGLITGTFSSGSAGIYSTSVVVSDGALNGSVAFSWTVRPAHLDQTISFGALASMTYGDSPFALSATASSGLAVNFTAGAGDSCTVSGTFVTITSAGSCTITAHQGGDSSYNAAPDVSQSFTITQAQPTIVWATPADIGEGTALSATQLNATSPVQGSFTYAPPAGTVLSVGSSTLTATFHPTDSNYVDGKTASVTINVKPAKGVITSPAPGSTLQGPSATFAWTAGFSATDYWLELGSTLGGKQYYSRETTDKSLMVSNLPLDGSTVYATLHSLVGGVWQANHYTYTAYNFAKAVISSPVSGAILAGRTVTFSWNNTGAVEYWLELGTTAGGKQLYSASAGTGTSLTVKNLPLDGSPVYATLYTRTATIPWRTTASATRQEWWA
jgi:hypothetical protein